MRINTKQLYALIEAIWRAEAPARYGIPPIDVEADDTRGAGEKAAAEFAAKHNVQGIDPFSISIKPGSIFSGETAVLDHATIVKKAVSITKIHAHDVLGGQSLPDVAGREAGLDLYDQLVDIFNAMSEEEFYDIMTVLFFDENESPIFDALRDTGMQDDNVDSFFYAMIPSMEISRDNR